jgi:hypothetical protein
VDGDAVEDVVADVVNVGVVAYFGRREGPAFESLFVLNPEVTTQLGVTDVNSVELMDVDFSGTPDVVLPTEYGYTIQPVRNFLPDCLQCSAVNALVPSPTSSVTPSPSPTPVTRSRTPSRSRTVSRSSSASASRCGF